MAKKQFLDISGAGRLVQNLIETIEAAIPTSLPANGGNAATVGGFTVGANVPANAKFTDTVYTHPNSGVTAGSYQKVTVDAKGHVTGGSNPTTLSGYGITDAATKAQGTKADTAVQTVKVGSTSYTGNTINLPAYPTSLPASDVPSWAKASSKPTYTASEVGADPSGSANTALTNAKKYTDDKIALILENPTEAVDSIAELVTAMTTNKDAIEALQSIAASKASASDLTSHTGNSTIHITAAERTKWNSAYTHANSAHAPSGAEVNQNAFSKMAVGSTTISSTGKTDTFSFVAGSNVTLTPDASNKKLTIAAKDTVYTHPSYTQKSSGLYKITVDSLGHISAATAVTKDDLVSLGLPSSNTTYGDVTSTSSGLMTAALFNKLNGIAANANNYVLPAATDETLGGVTIGSNITNTDGEISLTKANVVAALGYTPPTTNTTYGVVTSSSNGLMSPTMLSKLNGIAANANNYTHPTTSGNKHIPSGGSSGQILRWSADGTAVWGNDNNTTYSVATTSANGLMSPAMVTKLNSCKAISVVTALPSSPDANTIYIIK